MGVVENVRGGPERAYLRRGSQRVRQEISGRAGNLAQAVIVRDADFIYYTGLMHTVSGNPDLPASVLQDIRNARCAGEQNYRTRGGLLESILYPRAEAPRSVISLGAGARLKAEADFGLALDCHGFFSEWKLVRDVLLKRKPLTFYEAAVIAREAQKITRASMDTVLSDGWLDGVQKPSEAILGGANPTLQTRNPFSIVALVMTLRRRRILVSLPTIEQLRKPQPDCPNFAGYAFGEARFEEGHPVLLATDASGSNFYVVEMEVDMQDARSRPATWQGGYLWEPQILHQFGSLEELLAADPKQLPAMQVWLTRPAPKPTNAP